MTEGWLQKTKRFWQGGRARDILILLLLLVVALIPRLYRLSIVPPGLDGDELFNAIDALKIGRSYLPVYFEGNNGREAIFLYMMAAAFRILGQTIFALRLPAALLGSASVLLTYLIGKQEFNRPIGFVGALLVALSIWPIMLSRWGLRAVSLTFFSSLTIFLFGLALRQEKRGLGLWIASGLSLGLSLFTYIPSRLFPLVIAGWFLWIALSQKELIRRKWRGMALSFIIALLIFAPFGLYMLRNPELVNQRVAGLTTSIEKAQAGEPSALWKTASSVLELFTIQGDPAERYNVEGRPVFDPLSGLFFYLGVAICIWKAFHEGKKPLKQAAYGLMPLWILLMLGPSLILGPHTASLRNAGAVIPIYLTAAIGLESLYTWVLNRWPQRGDLWRYATAGFLGLGFILITLDSWQAYFSIWPSGDKVREVFHAGLAEIGELLEEEGADLGSNVFIAYDYAADASPRAFKYYSQAPLAWFEYTNAFPWRPEQSEAHYLATVDKPLPKYIEDRITPLSDIATYTFENDDPSFSLYTLDPRTIDWAPEHAAQLTYLNGPTLIGFDLPEVISKGEQADIYLHWLIPENLDGQSNKLTFAEIRLIDLSGNEWAQAESLIGYPQAGWQSGDRFVQAVSVDIPEGIPPGPVYLKVILRDGTGPPYAITSETTADLPPDTLGPLLVQSSPINIENLPESTLIFDGRLALMGTAFSTNLVPGLPIDIALDWVAIDKPVENYRAQLILIDPDGGQTILSQSYELWPVDYPPTEWKSGEPVTTFHRLDIPADLDIASNPILNLNLLPEVVDDPLIVSAGDNTLAELNLILREHVFEEPDVPIPLEAAFGENVRLLGYDLENASADPGGEIRLSLVWQALGLPPVNYTIFNHLGGSDGQIWGQFDSPPVGDAWLTTTWLPGEYIVEERVIPINADAPPGTYELLLGLYDPADLTRLPVMINDHRQPNDQLLITEITIGS